MALPGGGLIRFGRRPADRSAGPLTAGELLAAMATPVLAIDPEGRIVDINAATEQFLNLSRNQILGRSTEEVIGHPLNTMPSDAPFAAYDLALRLPEDRELKVDLMVSPLPDRLGWRVVSLHGHARGPFLSRTSEREGGTRTAVAAAAMLAHEIKNPLSAVRGAAQLLETSVDEGSVALTSLIRDEVDRVAALIDRMQGFTDTRHIELHAQNIHAILAHAREVALQGFAKGREIRELYDPSLPPMFGHRDSMIQILINLMKNASEALGHGPGTITLTTAYRHGVSMRRLGDEEARQLPIEICVIDDGPGATPEMGTHLFDPFVTSKRTGSGLGLALVEKLVTDQGGFIEYAREGRPQRTVFRILMPRAKGAA